MGAPDGDLNVESVSHCVSLVMAAAAADIIITFSRCFLFNRANMAIKSGDQ